MDNGVPKTASSLQSQGQQSTVIHEFIEKQVIEHVTPAHITNMDEAPSRLTSLRVEVLHREGKKV